MHQTSLDLGGAVVIGVYFIGILLIGAIVKPMLRAWHDRHDEREDDRQIDYFADLRERDLRERHRQEWRDALRQYRAEGGRHD